MKREFLTNYSAPTKGLATKIAYALSGPHLTTINIHKVLIVIRDQFDRQIEASLGLYR